MQDNKFNGQYLEYKVPEPMVYVLLRSPGKKSECYLAENAIRFKEPEKYYGDYVSKAHHMVNYFKNTEGSTGCLLVGSAGSGKSMLAELMCNIIMDEFKYPIIRITPIDVASDYENSLVKFIDKSCNNCCIYVDEFAKCFSLYEQKNFLSILTNTSKRIFWIFTENSTAEVNKFIMNRPGRIRYLLTFNKLPYRVFDEYLKDYPVEENFKGDLLDAFLEAETFSFDYLQSIVSEHYYAPELTFNEVVEFLNIKSIKSNKFLVIRSIKYLGHEVYPFTLFKDPKQSETDTKDPMASPSLPRSRLDPFGQPIREQSSSAPLNGLAETIYLKFDLKATRFNVLAGPIQINPIADIKLDKIRTVKETYIKVPLVYLNEGMTSRLSSHNLKVWSGNPPMGIPLDKQFFSTLVSNQGLISIAIKKSGVYSHPKEYKDLGDKFDMDDFLVDPYAYGNKNLNIEPLGKYLENPKEKFDSLPFQTELVYDPVSEDERYKFKLKNQWLEINLCLVDAYKTEV